MPGLAQEVPWRPHGACGLVASSCPSLSCWASSSSGVTLVLLEQPALLGLPGLVFQTAPTRTSAIFTEDTKLSLQKTQTTFRIRA